MAEYLLAIDEGTTSTRALVFDKTGQVISQVNRPLTQHYPEPGWVEHDAQEIWEKTIEAAREAIIDAGGVERIATIGLTNQRQTVVFWDRRTGHPVAPAIVWQDRRTWDVCADLKDKGHEDRVRALSGLPIDPYFSATKIAWGVKHWPAVKSLHEAGFLAVGTIDSYLLFRLTGGVHATDASNASGTMLMDLTTCHWSDELCALFGVDIRLLPKIVDSAGHLGETRSNLFRRSIPITAMVGDQQAATIGQACFEPGAIKATYGTGCFMLTPTGDTPTFSQNYLLSTVGWRINGYATYALEGSIFVAGSGVKWLRDQLGLVASSAETEMMARSVPSTEGVYFVPAFVGLGAPHWQPGTRALITGMTFGTTRAHIVRAYLEAMSYQTCDLLEAFARDGVKPAVLRVDGGMALNDWLVQDLADMLNLPLERPQVTETTALGAALLAGVGAGLFNTLEDAASVWHLDARFDPKLDEATRTVRLAGWHGAVDQVLTGVKARG